MSVKRKRPKCPRCKTGWLTPEYAPWTALVDSVKCIICGERIYKNYKLHNPTPKDKLQGALDIWS